MVHAHDTRRSTLYHRIYARTSIRRFSVRLMEILVWQDVPMPIRKSPNLLIGLVIRALCAHLLQIKLRMHKKLYSHCNHLFACSFLSLLLSCFLISFSPLMMLVIWFRDRLLARVGANELIYYLNFSWLSQPLSFSFLHKLITTCSLHNC